MTEAWIRRCPQNVELGLMGKDWPLWSGQNTTGAGPGDEVCRDHAEAYELWSDFGQHEMQKVHG
jgi:hypothetical protein